MNALLDYGSSSSNDSDEDASVPKESSNESNKPKLPKPSIGEENALQTSVFSNPFVQAELAKAAILEKHVKMVPGKGDTHMINGRTICWNYRKGRCRFGHNCKFAHDSDIQKTQEELEMEKKNLKTVVCESPSTVMAAVPPEIEVETISRTDDAIWEGGADRRKLKRPGLSQGIVPSQKVLKMYKDQKSRENKKFV